MSEVVRLAGIILAAGLLSNPAVIAGAILVVAIIILVAALYIFRGGKKKAGNAAASQTDWQRQQAAGQGGWGQQAQQGGWGAQAGQPGQAGWGAQAGQPQGWGAAQQPSGWEAQNAQGQQAGWGTPAAQAQQQPGGWGTPAAQPQAQAQQAGWGQAGAQPQATWGSSPQQQQQAGWGDQTAQPQQAGWGANQQAGWSDQTAQANHSRPHGGRLALNLRLKPGGARASNRSSRDGMHLLLRQPLTPGRSSNRRAGARSQINPRKRHSAATAHLRIGDNPPRPIPGHSNPLRSNRQAGSSHPLLPALTLLCQPGNSSNNRASQPAHLKHPTGTAPSYAAQDRLVVGA